MAMTARDIVKNTFPSVKKAARYAVIQKVTPGFLKSGSHKITAVVYTTATADGNPHRGGPEKYKCVVYGLTPETRLKKDSIRVSCTCGYFCFTSEYALYKQGAAEILFCNGEAPDIRNPRYIPTPCKHLYAVLTEMLKAKV